MLVQCEVSHNSTPLRNAIEIKMMLAGDITLHAVHNIQYIDVCVYIALQIGHFFMFFFVSSRVPVSVNLNINDHTCVLTITRFKCYFFIFYNFLSTLSPVRNLSRIMYRFFFFACVPLLSSAVYRKPISTREPEGTQTNKKHTHRYGMKYRYAVRAKKKNGHGATSREYITDKKSVKSVGVCALS